MTHYEYQIRDLAPEKMTLADDQLERGCAVYTTGMVNVGDKRGAGSWHNVPPKYPPRPQYDFLLGIKPTMIDWTSGQENAIKPFQVMSYE